MSLKFLCTGSPHLLQPRHFGLFLESSRSQTAYKFAAHLVTRRPSFRQCAGSRFSDLHSIKSSIIYTNKVHLASIFASPRTIEVFAFCADEESGALQRRAGRPNFLNGRHIVWHRRPIRIRAGARAGVIVVGHSGQATKLDTSLVNPSRLHLLLSRRTPRVHSVLSKWYF